MQAEHLSAAMLANLTRNSGGENGQTTSCPTSRAGFAHSPSLVRSRPMTKSAYGREAEAPEGCQPARLPEAMTDDGQTNWLMHGDEPATERLFCPQCGRRITVEILGNSPSSTKSIPFQCPHCWQVIRLELPGAAILVWRGHGDPAEPFGLPMKRTYQPIRDEDVENLRIWHAKRAEYGERIEETFGRWNDRRHLRREIIAALSWWHHDAANAPVLCGATPTHGPLAAMEEDFAVKLYCSQCVYTQATVPDHILKAYRDWMSLW